AAQPLLLLIPRRMTYAIGIAEAGDRRGEDLNPAGWSPKRILFGIGAKAFEHLRALDQHRPQVQWRALAKLIECGQRDARPGGILASDVPKVLDPLLRRAPFGELR